MDALVLDNYMRISNELLEAIIQTRLSAYESCVLWAIIRKTHGFRKKMDYIPTSQLERMTKIYKAHVCRARKQLIERNIVTQGGNKIGINEDYQAWRQLPKGVTTHKVTYRGNFELPKGVDSKETIKGKKKLLSQFFFLEACCLSCLLLEYLETRNPNHKLPNLKTWMKDMQLLLTKDKRPHKEIIEVIAWCQQNEFWQANIRSPMKLRAHYDQLWEKMKKQEKEKRERDQPTIRDTQDPETKKIIAEFAKRHSM